MRTGYLSLKYEDCPTSDIGAGRIIIESYMGSIPILPSGRACGVLTEEMV